MIRIIISSLSTPVHPDSKISMIPAPAIAVRFQLTYSKAVWSARIVVHWIFCFPNPRLGGSGGLFGKHKVQWADYTLTGYD